MECVNRFFKFYAWFSTILFKISTIVDQPRKRYTFITTCACLYPSRHRYVHCRNVMIAVTIMLCHFITSRTCSSVTSYPHIIAILSNTHGIPIPRKTFKEFLHIRLVLQIFISSNEPVGSRAPISRSIVYSTENVLNSSTLLRFAPDARFRE